MSEERKAAETKVQKRLGWWINDEGKREWTQMGDPWEEKATAAEVRAYEMLITLQMELNRRNQ